MSDAPPPDPDDDPESRTATWDTAPAEDPAVMNAILDILFRTRSQRPAA